MLLQTALLLFVLLPPATRSARTIHFIHTSTEQILSNAEECVVESIMKQHPDDKIIIHSNHFLHKIPGASILEYDPFDIFAESPLSEWYLSGRVPMDLSDALRLAILYKYGGVYLDLDLIGCVYSRVFSSH